MAEKTSFNKLIETALTGSNIINLEDFMVGYRAADSNETRTALYNIVSTWATHTSGAVSSYKVCFWKGTKAEYSSLMSKDSNTLYFVTGTPNQVYIGSTEYTQGTDVTSLWSLVGADESSGLRGAVESLDTKVASNTTQIGDNKTEINNVKTRVSTIEEKGVGLDKLSLVEDTVDKKHTITLIPFIGGVPQDDPVLKFSVSDGADGTPGTDGNNLLKIDTTQSKTGLVNTITITPVTTTGSLTPSSFSVSDGADGTPGAIYTAGDGIAISADNVISVKRDDTTGYDNNSWVTWGRYHDDVSTDKAGGYVPLLYLPSTGSGEVMCDFDVVSTDFASSVSYNGHYILDTRGGRVYFRCMDFYCDAASEADKLMYNDVVAFQVNKDSSDAGYYVFMRIPALSFAMITGVNRLFHCTSSYGVYGAESDTGHAVIGQAGCGVLIDDGILQTLPNIKRTDLDTTPYNFNVAKLDTLVSSYGEAIYPVLPSTPTARSL